MDANTHVISWFEIPVQDLDRARHFYQVAFSVHMDVMDMEDFRMALFPGAMNSTHSSGALIQHSWYQPSEKGVLIYLNADPSMDEVIGRIRQEGGEIIQEKRLITENLGYMAVFKDTEGNTVALHAMG